MKRPFRYAVKFSLSTVVSLFAALSLGGCTLIPATFSQTEMSRESISLTWTRPTTLQGKTPLGVAIQELVRAEVLDQWPLGRDPGTLVLPDNCRLGDIRDAIERECAWVYVDRRFVRYLGVIAQADADNLGRPRVRAKFSIRFVRVAGSLSLDELSAGVTLFEYCGSVPEGVDWKFSNQSERSFVDGTQGVVGDTAVINTTRKSVSSGINYQGRTMLMPGGYARLDGQLDVSAFVGKSLDRNQTQVPLTCDLRRGEWVAVHMFTGLDASASYGFHGDGLGATVGGERIRVDVRVE